MTEPARSSPVPVEAATMRAFVIREFGPPEVLEPAALPRPSAGPGEVLIRVAATSVNPVDCKIRDGRAAALAPDFPAVLHMDVAGVVEAVGEGVSTFAVGEAVYGCAGGLKGPAGNLPGALADYMVADARLLAPKPASLSFEEAAALPLVALTAWEGLVWKASVGPGERVLVHGATGGVGHIALQLAAVRGAEVWATASTEEKRRIGLELGADGVIDYREETVEAYVKRATGGVGFDLVFDTVGGANAGRSFEAARVNGQVVSITGVAGEDLGLLRQKALSLHPVVMLLPMRTGVERERHGEILREVGKLVEAGQIRPLVDAQRFSFEEAAAAHARAESGDQIGKVVLSNPSF